MEKLAAKIATIIADYRDGEISPPDQAHVTRWINQFPHGAREPVLSELAHVLNHSYLNGMKFKNFVAGLVTNPKIVGGDPKAFWKGVRFLAIQTQGHSQREILALFDHTLRQKCGLSIHECGKITPHSYLYIDDVLYSGGRVSSDIINWIKTAAPEKAKLMLIFGAMHLLGQFFATNDIKKAAKGAGKEFDLDWRCAAAVEDRKAYMAKSDVLRPTVIPNDEATKSYVANLGADPVLRAAGNVGELGIFSSDVGRTLLEQRFLVGGVLVRERCRNLDVYMRPLGRTMMRTTGFGSTIVTYRNCANNTPLVLWAGDPWYPLFPRKTN